MVPQYYTTDLLHPCSIISYNIFKNSSLSFTLKKFWLSKHELGIFLLKEVSWNSLIPVSARFVSWVWIGNHFWHVWRNTGLEVRRSGILILGFLPASLPLNCSFLVYNVCYWSLHVWPCYFVTGWFDHLLMTSQHLTVSIFCKTLSDCVDSSYPPRLWAQGLGGRCRWLSLAVVDWLGCAGGNPTGADCRR